MSRRASHCAASTGGRSSAMARITERAVCSDRSDSSGAEGARRAPSSPRLGQTNGRAPSPSASTAARARRSMAAACCPCSVAATPPKSRDLATCRGALALSAASSARSAAARAWAGSSSRRATSARSQSSRICWRHHRGRPAARSSPPPAPRGQPRSPRARQRQIRARAMPHTALRHCPQLTPARHDPTRGPRHGDRADAGWPPPPRPAGRAARRGCWGRWQRSSDRPAPDRRHRSTFDRHRGATRRGSAEQCPPAPVPVPQPAPTGPSPARGRHGTRPAPRPREDQRAPHRPRATD